MLAKEALKLAGDVGMGGHQSLAVKRRPGVLCRKVVGDDLFQPEVIFGVGHFYYS